MNGEEKPIFMSAEEIASEIDKVPTSIKTRSSKKLTPEEMEKRNKEIRDMPVKPRKKPKSTGDGQKPEDPKNANLEKIYGDSLNKLKQTTEKIKGLIGDKKGEKFKKDIKKILREDLEKTKERKKKIEDEPVL